MRIIRPDAEIIKELKNNGISKEMSNFFETSDWLVLGDADEEIVGAAGIGGFFNLASVEVIKKVQGKE